MKKGTIELKEVLIHHADGTSETVYVQDDLSNESWKETLQVAYTVVGIVAVSLTAYLAFTHLKKSK
jgi:O-methyltransferase involved in polyketide biosynthesis